MARTPITNADRVGVVILTAGLPLRPAPDQPGDRSVQRVPASAHGEECGEGNHEDERELAITPWIGPVLDEAGDAEEDQDRNARDASAETQDHQPGANDFGEENEPYAAGRADTQRIRKRRGELAEAEELGVAVPEEQEAAPSDAQSKKPDRCQGGVRMRTWGKEAFGHSSIVPPSTQVFARATRSNRPCRNATLAHARVQTR